MVGYRVVVVSAAQEQLVRAGGARRWLGLGLGLGLELGLRVGVRVGVGVGVGVGVRVRGLNTRWCSSWLSAAAGQRAAVHLHVWIG